LLLLHLILVRWWSDAESASHILASGSAHMEVERVRQLRLAHVSSLVLQGLDAQNANLVSAVVRGWWHVTLDWRKFLQASEQQALLENRHLAMLDRTLLNWEGESHDALLHATMHAWRHDAMMEAALAGEATERARRIRETEEQRDRMKCASAGGAAKADAPA
jgi:hypothetical protein